MQQLLMASFYHIQLKNFTQISVANQSTQAVILMVELNKEFNLLTTHKLLTVWVTVDLMSTVLLYIPMHWCEGDHAACCEVEYKNKRV